MKIKEIETDRCDGCPLIEWCGDPYEDPHFCCDRAFEEVDVETYIRMAESSKEGTKLGIADDVLKRLRAGEAGMELRWKDDPEIGYYELRLIGGDGKVIDDHLALWDYTCEYQRNNPNRDWRLESIAFRWTWCCGWSHDEEYKSDEGLTLEQAKRRAEIWLLNTYVSEYMGCMRRAEYLKPIVEWARKKVEEGEDAGF